MARVDYERGEIYLDAPDVLEERALDGAYGARVGPLRWSLKAGDVKQRTGGAVQVPSLSERSRNLLRALTSGPTPVEVLAVRRLQCFGDPAAGSPPCPALEVSGTRSFCSECGCPRWVALETKLRMAGFSCPRKRQGFANSPKENA